MLTHLSLFSGIGGLDLAAEWAGFETVGQCEWADYPTKVLEKRWPTVPRWRDIRTLTAEDFYAKTGLRTVDVISGGFPCQPFSVAGKQKGKGDDRYLWPEMCRVIRELKPRWVVGENVPGILRIAAADVVQDLEREGFDVVVLDFEAAAVGAYHRRERVAFVAHHPDRGRRDEGEKPSVAGRKGAESAGVCADVSHAAPHAHSYACGAWRPSAEGQQRQAGPASGGNDVANSVCGGCGENRERKSVDGIRNRRTDDAMQIAKSGTYVCDATSQRLQDGPDLALGEPGAQPQPQRPMRWPAEPDVGRVAYGIPHRVDRLRCLGNAVVPQQFYPIFKAIAEECAYDHL